MKDFDPNDFNFIPIGAAVPKFTVKNGDWSCAACGGTLGAVETDTGWETFVPKGCPTQQTCSNRVAELAEFALDLDKGSRQ